MKRALTMIACVLALGLVADAASAQTLKTVKDRGVVSCGVSQGLPGFSHNLPLLAVFALWLLSRGAHGWILGPVLRECECLT